MAGHSPSKTGVNALLSRPSRLDEHSAFLSEAMGTSPVATRKIGSAVSNDANDHPLLRAATRDGVMLPVIDITDPRFTVADDAASRARLFEQAALEEQQNRRLPKFIMKFLLRRAATRPSSTAPPPM